ncbi:Arf-like protein [Aureococcus anophagefferens]|nr:Arf-like protein [Aureococcus anophagefferens]
MDTPTMQSYKSNDLAFARESPAFDHQYEFNREELGVADEHLRSLTGCASALVAALQALGGASQNLGLCLERTPALFQASPVTEQLAGVLQDLASAASSAASTTRGASPRARTPRPPPRRASCSTATGGASARRRAARLARGDDAGDLPASLAAVVDARARDAAEKRRLGELKRFELCRVVSSLQRRKGLALAESSLAALCSLRAFYAQASHAVADAATAAHGAQTAIAAAVDEQRAPWDYRMLKLQEALNGMPHLRSASPFAGSDDDGAPLPQLLARAEDAYGVYGVEDALAGLYAPADAAEPPLEAYLFSQAVGTTRRRAGVVHSVLARELSEEDVAARAAHRCDLEPVATLLLSSVKPAPNDRCAFEVRSAHGSPVRLQARGDAAAAAWMARISRGIEAQLTSGRSRGPRLRREPAGDARWSPRAEAARRVRAEARSPACAACDAARPEWCVINFGVLVCLRCSGVHRSLGTHVSKVRSLRLDRLPDSVLRFLEDTGNAAANAAFEAAPACAAAKPTPRSDAKALQAFARQMGAAFCAFDGAAARRLDAAVAGGDAVKVLEALAAADGDPRALLAGAGRATPPLHAAPRGHLVAAQGLLLNGDAAALLAATDAAGRTPRDRLAPAPPTARAATTRGSSRARAAGS